ncbi:MAG: ferrous iron transport protein B [Candidatus Delongbacteria bacterium]|nr:ferrous iron transport protein B [Candidatus Delongbacteria bacterium]
MTTGIGFTSRAERLEAFPEGPELERPLHVALAGNPNSGKTTLFNALTGSNHQVGNYPGVTVEKRLGLVSDSRFPRNGFQLFDLPGTYSLSSWSPEERIAQAELLSGTQDVIVVVADASTLSRSLVLLAQVMLTGANPVLCLNMADEAERSGQRLDLAQMRALLGFPVVETSAKHGIGLEQLRQAILEQGLNPVDCRRRVTLGADLRGSLDRLESLLNRHGIVSRESTWLAVKLLKCDPDAQNLLGILVENSTDVLDATSLERKQLEALSGMDLPLLLGSQLAGFANGLLREVTLSQSRADARAMSDAIDGMLVHRWLGLPIFLMIMYGIFWLTFSLGQYPMDWIESGFGLLAGAISSLWVADSPSLLRSLLVDGMIAGVGGVVVFLPNIVLLFAGLALLEDTGYMARAAFIMDRMMHRFGLHGQSFLPLMSGFGCSIPGIMATRTLENEKDRLVTMLVLPLMSCGARLPIWMLLIPAFFSPGLRAPALWGIYMAGIVLALGLSLLLKRSVLRGEDTPFVMELPPYRIPTGRAVIMKMAERSRSYLRKAGTLILGVSIVLWALTSFPRLPDREFPPQPADSAISVEAAQAAAALQYSLAGRIGRAIEPVFAPLGFDWKITTGLLGAFAAKEVFVSQMSIVFSLGGDDENVSTLSGAIQREYSPLTGISLMLFLLIGTPCMATVAVMRKESGSWKWALLQFGGLTVLAWLISLAVYQIGGLFL